MADVILSRSLTRGNGSRPVCALAAPRGAGADGAEPGLKSCATAAAESADDAQRLPGCVGRHDGMKAIGLAGAAVVLERLAGAVRADG